VNELRKIPICQSRKPEKDYKGRVPSGVEDVARNE
jgi:hypothetical protein